MILREKNTLYILPTCLFVCGACFRNWINYYNWYFRTSGTWSLKVLLTWLLSCDPYEPWSAMSYVCGRTHHDDQIVPLNQRLVPLPKIDTSSWADIGFQAPQTWDTRTSWILTPKNKFNHILSCFNTNSIQESIIDHPESFDTVHHFFLGSYESYNIFGYFWLLDLPERHRTNSANLIPIQVAPPVPEP